ncbi:hypothetical protein DBP12_03455 [Streptomyces sp. CS014]|nr:hypothetical protein DBP12_03455 [Streptomyces sp. CS014]
MDAIGVKPVGWLPVYEITEDVARKLMEINEANRPMRQSVVQRYVDDMENGRWHFVGDPIVIDEEGNMRSGQHRCRAGIRAKRTFRATVIEDVPVEAFASIDTGAKRSPGNQLSIAYGVHNASMIAAIIPRFLDISEGRILSSGKKPMSPQAIVSWYGGNPDMRELLQTASRLGTQLNAQCQGGSVAAMGATYAALHQVDANDARRFFVDHLINAEGWESSPYFPPRKLVQFIIAHCCDGSRTAERDLVWSMIKCWNEWRTGGQVKTIRPRVNGSYIPISPL